MQNSVFDDLQNLYFQIPKSVSW